MSDAQGPTLRLNLTDDGRWQAYVDDRPLGLPFSRTIRLTWEYSPNTIPAPEAGIAMAEPSREELKAVLRALATCNATPLTEVTVMRPRDFNALPEPNRSQLVFAVCRKSEAPAGWYVLENCLEDVPDEELGEVDWDQTAYGCAARLAEAIIAEWGLAGRIADIEIEPIA